MFRLMDKKIFPNMLNYLAWTYVMYYPGVAAPILGAHTASFIINES